LFRFLRVKFKKIQGQCINISSKASYTVNIWANLTSLTPSLCIEVSVPSQKSERSCICVLWVSIVCTCFYGLSIRFWNGSVLIALLYINIFAFTRNRPDISQIYSDMKLAISNKVNFSWICFRTIGWYVATSKTNGLKEKNNLSSYIIWLETTVTTHSYE
jgi:hypothetical protein